MVVWSGEQLAQARARQVAQCLVQFDIVNDFAVIGTVR
jgi:hypothetical protein